MWLGSPYDIIVNAEYYLYDWISMIGAIGGTLGLCIGFSFMDFVRNLITFFIQGLKRIVLFFAVGQRKMNERTTPGSERGSEHRR